MKLVEILATRDDADVLDAHLAFHLSAGVDFVLVKDEGSADGTVEILDAYARDGYVRRLTAAEEDPVRMRMARLAATEHGADWVISSDADEFWWPRGESLKDVLAAIPPRYGVVQALVRAFPPAPREEGFFAERMTRRPSLLGSAADRAEPLSFALRPVYRADAALIADPGDGTEGGLRVPLRAWYPIELLRFPFRSREQTTQWCERGRVPRSQIEADALAALKGGRLPDWYAAQPGDDSSLAVDERLRDALRVLRASSEAGAGRAFALSSEIAPPLMLKAPDVVDDASYAGECAAVGEVDLEGLERQIVELEGRISWLEERFWPRVVRTLSRAVRR